MSRYYKFDNINKVEPFIARWDGTKFKYIMTMNEFKSMLIRSNRNKLLSFLNKPTYRQITGDEYLLYAFALYKAVANSGILNKYVDNYEEVKDESLFK